jgi:hypothetical protein
MHSPFVLYLAGTCILSVGLVILLAAKEIARGLSRFWSRWLETPADAPSERAAAEIDVPPNYRARLIAWRMLGALFVVDGAIFIVRATSQVLHALPRMKP